MNHRSPLLAALVLTACASTTQTPVVATSHVAPHAAHELLVNVGACWLGGMWGDVQGETPPERVVSSRERCANVVMNVFPKGNYDRFLQLRAFEPETVAEVEHTLATMAASDPTESHRKDAYARLFDALAGAEREVMHARRAAHRITRDVGEPEKLSASEAAALPELEASSGFDALMRVDAGDLQKEAHVFALLVTLDRMQVAEQLPVHLKPYVIAAPLHAVFATPAPDLPHDSSKPLARGAWLTYLTTAAASAGHAVTDSNAKPLARHEEAIAGILEGIADQLERDIASVSPDTALPRVVELTIRSLVQSRQRVTL